VSPWQIIAEALGQRLDADLIPALYAAASVPVPVLRAELRAAGQAFVDPEAGQVPEADELARTIAWVVKSSSRTAAAIGAVGGAGGLLSVAPELAASAVSVLRLAQRLALVHGIDPDTDGGKLVIARALAAAYEVRLPDSTRVTTRMSDLGSMVRVGPGGGVVAGWVGKQVARQSLAAVVRRAVRLVPGLSIGLGGFGAWRRQLVYAERMCAVYARTVEALPFDLGDEALAEEVR